MSGELHEVFRPTTTAKTTNNDDDDNAAPFCSCAILHQQRTPHDISMSNEASRDHPRRPPAIGSSSSLVGSGAGTPPALEEAFDDSRSLTPVPPPQDPEGLDPSVDVDVDAEVGGSSGGRGAQITAAARRAVISQTKIKFLMDFIRSMDMVVYYYFSYMYFLECVGPLLPFSFTWISVLPLQLSSFKVGYLRN